MNEWFNTAAFVDPCASPQTPCGVPGNVGIDTISAPGYKDVDVSLLRNFTLVENVKLQLRFDAFNAFNWVNLGYLQSSMNDQNPALAFVRKGDYAALWLAFGCRLAWAMIRLSTTRGRSCNVLGRVDVQLELMLSRKMARLHNS